MTAERRVESIAEPNPSGEGAIAVPILSRSVLVKAVADVLARAAGLVTFPLIARQAGVEGFGAWTQAQVLTGIGVLVASLGMTTSMVRYFAAAWTADLRGGLLRALGLVLGASITLAALTAASAPWLDRWFVHDPQGGGLVVAAAIFLVPATLELLVFDFVRARQQFFLLAGLQTLQGALMVLAAVTWVGPLSGLMLLFAAAKAATLVPPLVWIALSRVSPPVSSRREMTVWDLVRFGAPMMAAGLGWWLMSLGDRLVLGWFRPSEDLGVYASLALMASFLTTANAPFAFVLYPRISRALLEGRRADAEGEIARNQRYVSLVLAPLTAYLFVMANPLLRTLVGSGFRDEPLALALLLVSMTINQWNASAPYVLYCHDRTAFMGRIWIAGGFANILANVLLVPRWGLAGAAFVTFATFLALDVLFFREASRHLRLARAYAFGSAWRASIAAAGGGLAVHALDLRQPSVAALALAGIVGLAAYLAILAFVGELRRGDALLLARAFGVRS